VIPGLLVEYFRHHHRQIMQTYEVSNNVCNPLASLERKT
jgi:hypothetical protein